MSIRQKAKKIIVIGGGVVESDGTRCFVRSQIAEYLYGLKKYYERVTWSTLSSGTRQYCTELDTSRIDLNIINKEQVSIYSLKGIFNEIKHCRYLAHSIKKSTDIIVSSVSVWSILHILLARLLGNHVLFYAGSDPVLLKKLRPKSLRGILGHIGNRVAFPICLVLAHNVVVRGETLLARSRRWNKNSGLSKPLISYKHLRAIKPRRTLDTDKLRILFVGKLTENKGAHLLIKSFAGLVKNNQDSGTMLFLTITGNGEMEQKLKSEVQRMALGSYVNFTGFIDDPNELTGVFRNSDVLVVPTLYHEGFPRVIDEARACGLIIICSRLGGMKDGLKESEALFISPGDVDDLSIALENVFRDSNLRKRLSVASQARAQSILKCTAAEQHANILRGLAPRDYIR